MANSKAPEAKPKILEFLKLGGSYKAACGYADISEETGYKYLSSDPEFSESVKKAKMRGEAGLVTGVLKIAREGVGPQKLTALMFLLNTTHGYSKKSEVSVKSETGGKSGSYREFIKVLDQSNDQDREAFAAVVERIEGNGGRGDSRLR